MRFRKFATQTIKPLNTFITVIGKGVSWLSFLLVVVVCYDVATRYLFKTSHVAVQELEWHIFAALFLFNAAYTLNRDKHVRVDVIYTRLSKRSQSIIDIVGTLIFLMPFCIVVIWSAWPFVSAALSIGETSPDPGGLPARYLLKAVIPIAFIFLLLQSLATVIAKIITLSDGDQ